MVPEARDSSPLNIHVAAAGRRRDSPPRKIRVAAAASPRPASTRFTRQKYESCFSATQAGERDALAALERTRREEAKAADERAKALEAKLRSELKTSEALRARLLEDDSGEDLESRCRRQERLLAEARVALADRDAKISALRTEVAELRGDEEVLDAALGES